MIFIIMGVSGSGKSTVGKILSEKLDCDFYDADDYHSRKNIEKMSRGIALTDKDRISWLKTIRGLILSESDNAVIACSALKQSYRNYLLSFPDKNIVFVYLKGNRETLQERLQQRTGHYAGPGLLDSQLATLEEPMDVLAFDIINEPEAIVQEILEQIDL